MQRLLCAILVCLLLAASAGAQSPQRWDQHSDKGIPKVGINDRSATLQTSLFPDYYKTHSVRSDMRWIRIQDSSLYTFWEENGARILRLLSDFSGLQWIEREFDIYLVRYYPTVGEGEPTIIPVGGIRTGQLTEAMPVGARQQLNLIYQLSHRMLAQAEQPEDDYVVPVAGHPLMQPGPFRRDNLAMLLALVTAQQVIGLDSTFDAYQSQFWSARQTGRQIFEQYLLNEWILSPDRPLAVWVSQEPYSSQLVTMTRPPRRTRVRPESQQRVFIQGLPIKGELGFSLTRDDRGRLVVDKIDPSRLAYACGLEEGDVVRQVDGARASSHKVLVERVLAGLDEGGATLSILREGQPMTVIIQPLELLGPEVEYYWNEEDETLEPLPVPEEPADST